MITVPRTFVAVVSVSPLLGLVTVHNVPVGRSVKVRVRDPAV
jgi:hypothetical protein